MFELYSRIDELAKKRGVSLQKVALDIGLSENYIYNLKNKKTANMEPIEKIADYFNVSLDYLMGKTNHPRVISDQDKYFFEGHEVNVEELAETAMRFNGKPLTDKDKKAIQGIIEGYLKSLE